MGLIELDDALARNGRWLAFQPEKSTLQIRFALLIGSGPRRQRTREQVMRRRHSQQIPNTWIQGWRLGIAPPNRIPRSIPPAEPLRRHQLTVILGSNP